MKCLRLGLTQKPYSNPSNVPLPKELPSVEETLKKLAMALDIASTPGLDRAEVQRLQLVAKLAKGYKEMLADYLNYRGVEVKLNDMEVHNDALLRETGKDDASKSVPSKVAEGPEKPRDNPTSQP